MNRFVACSLRAALVLMLSLPARAEKRKMAVMDLIADTRLDEGTLKTLNEILLNEFTRSGQLDVLGSSDIASMLSLQEEKVKVTGCGGFACDGAVCGSTPGVCRNHWTGVGCDVCPGHREGANGADCNECQAGWDIATGCTTCMANVHSGDLAIDDLTTLAAAQGITEVTGSLQIVENGNADIDALSSLRFIGGDIRINDCSALTSLAGLAGLDAAAFTGDIQIDDNTSLPACEVDTLGNRLRAAGWLGALTAYSNNGAGTCD